MGRFADVIKRFAAAISVLILLGLAAFWSVKQVRFSADILTILPGDLPEVQGMIRLNQHFGRQGELIVTLDAPNLPTAEQAAQELAALFESHPELVGEVFWELPLDELAQKASGLLSWLWLNMDPQHMPSLEERLAEGNSQEAIEDTLEALSDAFIEAETVVRSYDPLGLMKIPGDLRSITGSEINPLVSKDGTFRVLYVEGAAKDFSDYREAAAWLDEMWALIHEWQDGWEQAKKQPVKIGFTGTPAFMGEIGTGMEKDMSGSLFLTTNLIATLFLLMHRRIVPLLWLIAMMLGIFVITINLGGLLYGDLSVMSAGFAAILMGLAVDYGVVLYREARHFQGDPIGLRQKIGPGIAWAAATTAAVFIALNLSSLPGISQLGSLVAIGVAVGAGVMLYAFSPLCIQFPVKGQLGPMPRAGVDSFVGKYALWTALAIPVVVLISSLIHGAPHLDKEFRPFKMRKGQSSASWALMESKLRPEGGAAPFIVVGKDSQELNTNLNAAIGRMEAEQKEGLIETYEAPTLLVPNLENQLANAELLAGLFSEQDRLVTELQEAGFSEEGWALTESMFDAWRSYLEPVLAQGSFAEWTMARVISHQDGEWAVLGAVTPTPEHGRAWIREVSNDNAAVASMRSLGAALNERISRDLVRVFFPMIAVLSLMLGLVFRNWRDVALTVFTMAFGAGILVVITHWTSLGWNSFNVCGVPLLFGTGLDYAIHMIFALRRANGDLGEVRLGISRALIFCGLSTTIGFGSLAFSSAEGLASLGQVCALGVLINTLAAVFLLPHWWKWLHRSPESPATPLTA